jgi:hypothetical protein
VVVDRELIASLLRWSRGEDVSSQCVGEPGMYLHSIVLQLENKARVECLA